MLFRESHILFRECDFVFVSAEEFVFCIYTCQFAMIYILRKFRSDLVSCEPTSFAIEHGGSLLKICERGFVLRDEFCFGGPMSIA